MTTQTTAAMQHTINELYNALWAALKSVGGEIVIKPRQLQAWGKPESQIEWLDDLSTGDKIIRLAEKDT